MNEETPHILVVQARYYPEIADNLLKGAVREFQKVGATHEVIEVPGSLEIPAAIRFAVRSMNFISLTSKRFHGFVALGCVIRGETDHYEHVARESARALQDLVMQYSLALGFGVLTVHNRQQALERSTLEGRNKGAEAARACLRMIEVKKTFHLYPR
ncbi:MAG: 6,7-dimethyl-8-ribityllumazine synthase [Proteobacteria bacterium]|nr:6,7-dimethyl-8-ribityllumazine synthase [Pseudomonadota bacterium]